MRLNQFLAHAGLGSRRAVEALVTSGQVTLNGLLATLQSQVDPKRDLVRLNGRSVVLPEQYTYLALHKPAGYTVTREDTHARRNVYELLPARFRRLAYVGRLDRDSEGLLLFSDDGELNHRILLPKHKVEREYKVRIEGVWTEEVGRLMKAGVSFPEGPPLAAVRVELLNSFPGGAELGVVLQEGKKREIRRLCASFHLAVTRLCRVRFGPVELADLAPGQTRELTSAEVCALRRLAHLDIIGFPAGPGTATL